MAAGLALALLACQAVLAWLLVTTATRADEDQVDLAEIVAHSVSQSVDHAIRDVLLRARSAADALELEMLRAPQAARDPAEFSSLLRGQLERTAGAAAIYFVAPPSTILSSGSADRWTATAAQSLTHIENVVQDLASSNTPAVRLVEFFAGGETRSQRFGEAWLYASVPWGLSLDTTSHAAIVVAFRASSILEPLLECPIWNCTITFAPASVDAYYDSSRNTWLNASRPAYPNGANIRRAAEVRLLPGTIVARIKTGSLEWSEIALLALVALATLLAGAILLLAGGAYRLHRLQVHPESNPNRSGASPPGSPTGMFRRLINANTTPIFVVDADLATIAYSNPAAAALFGTTCAESAAQSFSRYFPLAPDILADLLANGGRADRIRVSWHGHELFADLRFGPAIIDGKRWSMVVITDASAAMEAERVAAQAREQLDQALKRRLDGIARERDNYRRMVDTLKGFTSTLAHEIKNPIQVIMTAAQNLATSTDPEAARRAAKIEKRAKTMTMIINRVLTAAKLEANALAPALGQENSLSLLRQDAQVAAEQDRRHNYVIEVEHAALLNLLDRDLFSLAITNVLGNAAKYSPEGSSITIRGEIDDGHAVIRIIDNGIGIPATERDKVFTRYYRASSAVKAGIPGNGLGMALCKEIIELHDGRIWVEETPGGGTTVCISLPVVPSTHTVAA